MIRKNYISLLVALLFLASACQETPLNELQDSDLSPQFEQKEPMSKSEINDFVIHQLQRYNKFEWNMADDHMIYSASVQSDSIMAVGYQIEGFENINERLHEINIQDKAFIFVASV